MSGVGHDVASRIQQAKRVGQFEEQDRELIKRALEGDDGETSGS